MSWLLKLIELHILVVCSSYNESLVPNLCYQDILRQWTLSKPLPYTCCRNSFHIELYVIGYTGWTLVFLDRLKKFFYRWFFSCSILVFITKFRSNQKINKTTYTWILYFEKMIFFFFLKSKLMSTFFSSSSRFQTMLLVNRYT